MALIIIVSKIKSKGNMLNKLYVKRTLIYVWMITVAYVMFCITYTPSISYTFRYMTCMYPLIILVIYLSIMLLSSNIINEKYRQECTVIVSIFFVMLALFSGIINNSENIFYLHPDNRELASILEEYNTKYNLFINKSDSQEYSFWMHYKSMSQRDESCFLVTTTDRIEKLSDTELKQMIKNKGVFEQGILIFVITSYNRQGTDKIVNQLADSIGFKNIQYIMTSNGERIYYCSF